MTFLVKIDTEPPLSFYSSDDAIPYVIGVGMKRLQSIGTLRRPLKVGGGTENASTSISLDNGDGALSRLWAIPPVKVRVTIDSIALEGVSRIFTGLLTRLELKSVTTLNLEV